MTNTLKHLLTAVVLTIGVGLTSANGIIYSHATLTGVGTVLTDSNAAKGATIEAAMHAAAAGDPFVRAEAAINMILGMLFIVLGFFLHAFFRSTHERKVHISVVPKKEKTTVGREAYFWMEMKV